MAETTRARCSRPTCFPDAGTEVMTDLVTTAGESLFVFVRVQAEYTVCKSIVLVAARISVGWLILLFKLDDTSHMTGLLTTAGDIDWNGARFLTEWTLSELGREKKWIVCHTLLSFSWLT